MKFMHHITAVTLAVSSTVAWGQAATVCNTADTPSPVITIAVASDFYTAARAFAKSFKDTTTGSGKVIRVCHNATGVLAEEIKADNSPYSLFLAANTAGPAGLPSSKKADTPRPYAFGIPVLWSKNVSETDLLASDGSVNTATVTSLAIGNPEVAPYGAAAVEILNDRSQWPGESGWITQYDNIALTKSAVDNGAQIAAFISKTQICEPAAGGAYATFPANYNLQQDGVVLANGDTTTATDFMNYLLSAEVQAEIVSKYCFASPPSSTQGRRRR